jgi:hypothetical protein
MILMPKPITGSMIRTGFTCQAISAEMFCLSPILLEFNGVIPQAQLDGTIFIAAVFFQTPL